MENLRIQHFERILQSNPKSRAFAPLAEAYRKNGELEKALELALKGVEANQDYNGGRVALARVLADLNQLHEARGHLEKVIESENDNILALRVLGKISLQLKDFERAIKVYSEIKALQPEDQNSEKILQGLQQNGVSVASPTPPKENSKAQTPQNLEKKLAFIDALLDQSKYAKAEAELKASLETYENNPDLKKRLQYIKGLSQPNNNINKADATTPYVENMKKIKLLNIALKNIEERQKDDSNFRL